MKGFNGAIDLKLEPVQKDITEMKVQNKKRCKKTNQLAIKVDEYKQRDQTNNMIITGLQEQRDRANNVIITDLQEDQAEKEAVRKILNEKVRTQLSVFDIDYTLKLKSNRESAPRRIKVLLREVWRK